MSTSSLDFTTTDPFNSTYSTSIDDSDFNIGNIIGSLFILFLIFIIFVTIKSCLKGARELCDGLCDCTRDICECVCGCLGGFFSGIGRCFGRIREGVRDLGNNCECVKCDDVRTSFSTCCHRITCCLRHSENSGVENTASTQTSAPDQNSRSTNTELSDIQTESDRNVVNIPDVHASIDSTVPPPSYESVMRGGGAYRDISLTGVVITDPPPSYDEVV